MSTTPYLSYDDAGGPAPHTIGLATGVDITMASVTALWDGSGASGTFKPCLSLYSQAGQLLSRSFPSTLMEAGDSGKVTYAPFLGLGAAAAAADGVSFAGVLGTGVNLVAPYDQDIEFDGTFVTNDPGTFVFAPNAEIQFQKAGTYFVSAMIAGWDSAFVNTRFWTTLNINGGNNPVLKNHRVIQPVIQAGDVVQLFDIFQYNGGLGSALTLHGASPTEDFINANADHSLIVWRMGEYLGWTGFD